MSCNVLYIWPGCLLPNLGFFPGFSGFPSLHKNQHLLTIHLLTSSWALLCYVGVKLHYIRKITFIIPFVIVKGVVFFEANDRSFKGWLMYYLQIWVSRSLKHCFVLAGWVVLGLPASYSWLSCWWPSALCVACAATTRRPLPPLVDQFPTWEAYLSWRK